MENGEIKKAENKSIVFFLGAGASVPAEVPHTEGFIYDTVRGFKKWINAKGSEEEKNVLLAILSTLEKKKKEISQYRLLSQQKKEKTEEIEVTKKEIEKFEKIDVEIVLETLYKLNNREVEILPEFYDDWSFKIKGKEEILQSLENKLRKFIRKKTIVAEDKIGYLEPLKEFVRGYGALEIFSVNYDTCIEQFSKKNGLRYTDGFELYWHPELFDDRSYDVKLYKTHGSVMWYLTDLGTYVKIPIASTEKDEIELITGETAKTLMVYPMGGKWEYAEPLLELLRKLHDRLEKADVCIVIGYSFRDDYIRRIFFEAARTNKDLISVLIAPDAGRIYDAKLAFIDKDKGIPSPLEGRVICWNYPVENVLKDYYLYRSLRKLFEILNMLEEAQKAGREIGSKTGSFQHGMHEVVLKCIDIGYISLAEKILAEELSIASDWLMLGEWYGDWQDKLTILFCLGVNNLYSGYHDKAISYFEEIKSELEEIYWKGNIYFEYNSQLTNLRKEGNPDKISEMDKKIDKMKMDKKASPYFTWFMCSLNDDKWVRLLRYGFIEFFKKQLDLRQKDDTSFKYFSNIIDKCNQMIYFLELPFNKDIYEGSDVIQLGNVSVEIIRKNKAAEDLKDVIGVFEDLITFCKEEKKISFKY